VSNIEVQAAGDCDQANEVAPAILGKSYDVTECVSFTSGQPTTIDGLELGVAGVSTLEAGTLLGAEI